MLNLATTLSCAIVLVISLFCDDFYVFISFLRIMFSIIAQRTYLSYFVWVDLLVFTGDVGTDAYFKVSFCSFASGSLDVNGTSP